MEVILEGVRPPPILDFRERDGILGGASSSSSAVEGVVALAGRCRAGSGVGDFFRPILDFRDFFFGDWYSSGEGTGAFGFPILDFRDLLGGEGSSSSVSVASSFAFAAALVTGGSSSIYDQSQIRGMGVTSVRLGAIGEAVREDCWVSFNFCLAGGFTGSSSSSSWELVGDYTGCHSCIILHWRFRGWCFLGRRFWGLFRVRSCLPCLPGDLILPNR